MKQTFWRRFCSNRGALIGLVILTIVVLVAVFAGVLAPNDTWDMVQRPFLPPFIDPNLPLGSDVLGRDVYSGLIMGARVSLLIGVSAALAGLLIGITVGALAGYFGGMVDTALMKLTELFQAIPHIVLAIVLVAIFHPSVVSIVVAISVVSWPSVARLVRGEFLSLKERDYVHASILAGQSRLQIIVFQILPNAAGPIVVMGSLMVATAILTESALSFLGLSDPNVMTWGYMIGAGKTALRTAWWAVALPGLAILLTVLAINLVGEGLSDGLNTRIRVGG